MTGTPNQPPIEPSAEPSQEPRPGPPTAPPSWFLMIGGERIGPVAHAEVLGMASKGQIGGSTPVWREGMAEWAPAREALGVRFASGGDADSAAIRMLVPVGRSGHAIAAGYLGLFALFPVLGAVTGPLAVLFGVLAVRHIRRDPTAHGLGRAWFGIIVGVLGTAVSALIIVAAMSS